MLLWSFGDHMLLLGWFTSDFAWTFRAVNILSAVKVGDASLWDIFAERTPRE